jgi:putative ABC transport system permease protein
MSGIIQDLRFALRQLRKNPWFAALAATVLALGIASTTGIFSVVDAVLLHSLPYPDSDQILSVSASQRSTGIGGGAVSPADYLDWAEQNNVFSFMAASRGWPVNVSTGDRPERLRSTVTSGDFFSLFRARPLVGRTLSRQDSTSGNDHVVVLGYGVWTRLFGGNLKLIGRDITINGAPYTVVGVMPANFLPDGYGELWLPSHWGVPPNLLRPDEDPRSSRDSHYLDAWARLKPGVTLSQARAEMDTIARRLEKQHPDADNGVGVGLVTIQDNLTSDVRPVLLLLSVAVGFVLLIACANVANLVLARATTRLREVSVRSALGASRMRLIRQLLTESVLLALLGGFLGVLLAVWAIPFLMGLCPPYIRALGTVAINRDVLAFSVAASLLSGIVFGVTPALQASRVNLNAALKEGERGTSGTHGRTRSVLAVGEIALSLVLLVGAGLLVKSFIRLMQVDPGFDPSHLLVFNVGLPPTSAPAQQDEFYRQVIERLRALPGVQSAAAVSRLPLAGGNSDRSFNLPGSQTNYQADIRVSTPGYFQTMSIPLLRGRLFSDADAHGSALVGTVNEALARAVFPGENPIGKHILNFGPQLNDIEIVGVVGNVRHVGLETPPRPEVYLPLGQAHWPSMFMAVRSRVGDPLQLTVAAQNAVASVNKEIPLANLRTMDEVIAGSVQSRRFVMQVLSIFAGIAIVLAAIGLYGIVSYSTSQRTREIGIRMALGAHRHDVLKLVLAQGMTLAIIGIALGGLASIVLTRLISGLLYGVAAMDPYVFAGMAGLLTSIALIANYIPARRAAKVDPMVALRYE